MQTIRSIRQVRQPKLGPGRLRTTASTISIPSPRIRLRVRPARNTRSRPGQRIRLATSSRVREITSPRRSRKSTTVLRPIQNSPILREPALVPHRNMFDPIAQSLHAVSNGSASAAGLVFLAGAASSVGPCTAPRLVAIAALTARQSARQICKTTLSFVAGLSVAYASLGLVAWAIGSVVSLSIYIYLALGIGLFCGAIVTLAKRSPACEGHLARTRGGSAGAIFLLGASFAFVVSPCCTPIVIAILAYTSQISSPAYAALLLCVFAIGHALPVLVLSGGVCVLPRRGARFRFGDAFGVVSGGLMLALSGYYLCLA